jgi:molybdate transport system substrate-binding protein
MRMRALLVVPLAALALTACGASSDDARDSAATSSSSAVTSGSSEISGTLTVFAAASLTDVFTELGNQLTADNPDLTVTFNFAGSSALATQIAQGAPADVFASADETQMAKVEDAKLSVDPEVFAQNHLMIAVPPDNPAGIVPAEAAGIPSLADLVPDDVTLAVCAPEVPCGAAAAKVLDAAGLGGAPDTFEDDVRAVLTKVELGEVDAGLVYITDVRAAGDKVLAYAFRESDVAISRYPVTVLTDAPNPAAAQAFVDLVRSDAGQQALGNASFEPA